MSKIKHLKDISKSLQKIRERKKANLKPRHPFGIAFTRMIPNIATVLALCSGLSSMRFAYGGEYRMAIAAILLAAIFDLMDGRLARMLGASSEFGAELDSLSDFVSFGAAPALVLYMASLKQYGSVGWAACLFFSVCSGFRLARFNILTRASHAQPKLKYDFFMGVPAPMGAILTTFPLMLFFATDVSVQAWPPLVFFASLIISGLLMVSKIPTFSSKSLVIPPRWWSVIMLASGIALASLYASPWVTLSIGGLAYILSIPVSYYVHRKLTKQILSSLSEKPSHKISEDSR